MRTRNYALIAGAILVTAAGMNPGTSGVNRGSGRAAATEPVNGRSLVSAATAASGVAAAPAVSAAPRAKSAVEVRREQVDGALEALEASVTRTSSSAALRTAFQAYFNFRAANPDAVRNPYLYFVDYGLDNRTPRGYVFDMDNLTLVEGPFIVAHGRGSSKGKNGVPTRFSNRHGAATTSLGLYVTQETYGFSGKAGGRHYTSVGLRLKGVSGDFNDAARSRGVVVHGAPYVTPRGAGRSEGCPAMEQSRARKLIPMIANGGLVFLYSPTDTQWVNGDRWATAES